MEWRTLVQVRGWKPRIAVGEETRAEPMRTKLHAGSWWIALCIGALFLLPHLVRIAELGSYAAYSPFTARTGSSMAWDETFLYGAEANYTLTRGGAPAYDDSWEHRNAVYPYSILPGYLEAGTAMLAGSMKNAHLLFSLVFPALAALLLMAIFRQLGAEMWLAALLAMCVLIGGFSPRTLWLDDRAFLLHAHGARAVDALEAARTPNPNISFPQLLLALLCLTKAMRRRPGLNSVAWASGAGVAGGLLFFSYVYYAIPWTVAVGLCSVVALIRSGWVNRAVWVSLAVTVLFAAPFVLWKHVSDLEGNYLPRSMRLGLEVGHALQKHSLAITLVWAVQALVCGAIWLWLRRRSASKQERSRNADAERWLNADAWMPVLMATMLGGLVGLNMQVVTGFNIQASHHFPHMVLQPIGLMLIGGVVALISKRSGAWHAVPVALCGLIVACAVAQFEAGRDSAALYRLTPARQQLFAWLNQNTAVGAVVATDDIELSAVLPVQTHDSVLFSDGSRSCASDDELLERMLFASHLSGTSAQQVQTELAAFTHTGVPLMSYGRYLWEVSLRYENDGGDGHVAADRLPAVMKEFAVMDVGSELRRFRVDYLWTQAAQEPANVPGWIFTPVLTNAEGRLWRLSQR